MGERGTSLIHVGIGAVVAATAVTLGLGVASAAAHATGEPPDPPPVLVVGHRGASAAAPEHTGAAYDRAVWAGADVLECDVQVTADDELVCVHDATVDRTTGGSTTGPVGSFTLDELRSMDFGTWFGPEHAGARVVTIDEQLTCYGAADPTMQFYIETKISAEDGDRMETLLVELLEEHDLIPQGEPDPRTSPVIIQSFDAASLDTVRALAPSLPTALLYNAPTPEIASGQLPDVEILAPNVPALTAPADFIDAAHSAGIEVHTWTVDDPALMAALIDAGIDGFFTNVPEVARGVVDDAGRGSGREPLDVDVGDVETSAVPGCPVGMGLGLTAASDDTSPDATSDTTQPGGGDSDDVAAPDDTDDDGGLPIVPMVAGLALLAVVVGFFALRSRRSSTPAEPERSEGRS